MSQKSLSNRQLSVQNLRRRPFRTACLIMIAAVMAFTLFGGSILTNSLRNGMDSMKQRLGADLMVVPDGYEANMEGVLLRGEPSYFYFSHSVVQQFAQIEGVSQITSQFFLTSLSESCCSSQVQLIGFDPNTDFVIRPWIAKTYRSTIGDGYLIAGSDIILESDNTLMLFNHSYPVAAQLEKTATGLDSSVFMTMDTMKSLVAMAREAGMNFISAEYPDGAVSSVLIEVEKGQDVKIIAKQITSLIPQIDVIISKDMIAVTSNALDSLIVYIRAFSAILWVIASAVLVATFSITVNERKKEFAVLRMMGMTRVKLVGVVLTESLIVSMAGGVIGSAVASAVIFPFSTYIGDKLQLPYLGLKADAAFGILALSLLLSIAVGPLSSIYSALKISKAETYLTMREGE